MDFSNKEVMAGLMDTALYLDKMQNTFWSEQNEIAWIAFERKCEDCYNNGIISAEQFDELILVAFWDYGELKCDSEEWCEWYEETHKGYVWNHDNFYKMVE